MKKPANLAKNILNIIQSGNPNGVCMTFSVRKTAKNM